MSIHLFDFEHSYQSLPEVLFSRLNPVPVKDPKVQILNEEFSKSLKLPNVSSAGLADIFSGNKLPEGSDPIAQAYAGDQFGHFNILGDGRAILLGEHRLPNGNSVDIQLKGSGITPYSRSGDGRATLGPMLREYILSEAMFSLRIPTTRSLAVVTTGEKVLREKYLPGAILTRVSSSHIRVGTFQYAAITGREDVLEKLINYTIQRHYPYLADSSNKALGLLEAVCERQADLIAKWLGVGFIHGVMNTDNTALSGETIDYGPCAFMDEFSFSKVFSSIDRQGRYAYINQVQIIHWNLSRFAETLLLQVDKDEKIARELVKQILDQLSETLERAFFNQMRSKLGLVDQESSDKNLILDLLGLMEKYKLDFTNTFTALRNGEILNNSTCKSKELTDWLKMWKQRLSRNPLSVSKRKALMLSQNPVVIPRNHKVEEALNAAVEHNDMSLTHKLLNVLKEPYCDRNDIEEYQRLPIESEKVIQTFCGT